jgi:hypothetical protein
MEMTLSETLLRSYWDSNKTKHESIVNKLHYYPCGIWFTEGFLLCSINDLLNVDLIVESGTAWGQSTEIFANYFPDKHVITIDTGQNYNNWEETKDRLSVYNNITCMKGDSYNVIPEVIQHYSDLRIGVFIDGPKGEAGVNLSNRLRGHKNIISVAFHDMPYGRIKSLLQPDAEVFHSHNLKFISDDYFYLNEKVFILDEEQKKWLPYGPSMAVELIKGA